MGRGGTKFESEAIGVRSGRKKGGVSFKDLKKDMETFKKTGRHPALMIPNDHVLPSLPVRDPNRPHAFLSFKLGKKDLGRMLVEVFEPELPLTSRAFLNRCNPGAVNTFKGTKVHQVVGNYALHGGLSKGHKGVQQRRNEFLRHVQKGLVSLTLSADAFAITLERALTLDDSHQVIGRVHGEESLRVLEALNDVDVGLNCEPLTAIHVSDCGQTDSQGNYDPLLGSKGKKESLKEESHRLKQEEAEARTAVGAALEQGLSHQRGPGMSERPGPFKRKRAFAETESESNSDTDSSGKST